MRKTPYRVLVVDDEQDMREELVALLEEHNFAVETANDGEAGLKKLLTDEFDVAIVDLKMPKMDGLTMIRRADEQEIDAYVIILTGKGDKQDAVAAIKLQGIVKDWFDKSSLDNAALVKRVTRLAKGMSFEEIDRLFANIPKESSYV
jgi:DNA-binding response OmpR family regulator